MTSELDSEKILNKTTACSGLLRSTSGPFGKAPDATAREHVGVGRLREGTGCDGASTRSTLAGPRKRWTPTYPMDAAARQRGRRSRIRASAGPPRTQWTRPPVNEVDARGSAQALDPHGPNGRGTPGQRLPRRTGRSCDQLLPKRTVRKRGLEPPRPCGHWNLNPARLPIPPLPRGERRCTVRRPRCQAGARREWKVARQTLREGGAARWFGSRSEGGPGPTL